MSGTVASLVRRRSRSLCIASCARSCAPSRDDYSETALGRVLGIVAIAAGTLIVGFNPRRFDVILVTIPIRQGHGIHLHDLLGLTLVTLGTLVLWFVPARAA